MPKLFLCDVVTPTIIVTYLVLILNWEFFVFTCKLGSPVPLSPTSPRKILWPTKFFRFYYTIMELNLKT